MKLDDIKNNECYKCLVLDYCFFTGIVHSDCYNKKLMESDKNDRKMERL